MRTDAKIGFAIVGVLLAVLTVYAIVVPKHKKTTVNTVSLVTTPGGGSSGGGSSGGGSSSASADSSKPESSSPIPPIVAASDSSQGGSTPIIPPANPVPPVVVVPSGPPVITDSSAMGNGSFHPIDETPKDITKPSDSRVADAHSGSFNDGVYTPGETKHAKASHGPSMPPLPDDTAPAGSTGERVYTIKPGQTLSNIAYEIYGNSRFWVAIQRENKGLNPNCLKVGSKINLPDISPVPAGPVTVSDEQTPAPSPAHGHSSSGIARDGHTYMVKAGDSLYGIAKRLLGSGRKADALYALNKDVIGPDKSRLKLGMLLKLPEAATSLADSGSVR
jgi:nucleoid-associated protein YgaU